MRPRLSYRRLAGLVLGLAMLPTLVLAEIGPAFTGLSGRADGDFRDAWIGTTGLKYRYGDDRAVAVGAMYGTSAISDGRRGIGLPLDRIVGVGAGLELPCIGHLCHINLNYLDLGDADLAEEGGALTGSIEGSFSRNWMLMLDFQLGMQF